MNTTYLLIVGGCVYMIAPELVVLLSYTFKQLVYCDWISDS